MATFDLRVYNTAELIDDLTTLHEVVDLVNKAYLKRKDFETGIRYPEDKDMVDENGADGLCAVVYSAERMIATASIRKWQPDPDSPVAEALQADRPDDQLLLTAGPSYEVKAVATVDTPETRGKGLVSRCLAAIEERIKSRDHEANAVGLLLWVITAENQTGAYWRRRGFELVGKSELKPAGFWGAHEPFWFSTLVKRIPGAS